MPDSVTLINHATVLIRLRDVSILTDPIYSWTISYIFPRMQKPGMPLQDLPPIDFVLISHHDYDHLNLKTLRRLRRRGASTMIVPKGLAPYGHKALFDQVVEVSPWQTVEGNGVSITRVPAKHVSKRRVHDELRSACCGYIVRAKDRCVYFAGDTGYSDFFREIADRYAIDLALLPIGAYKPYNWFKDLHLHPTAAIQAFIDLRAKHLVPIHWGTFWISDEPMDEPPVLLQREAERLGLQESVHILRNGDQFML